MSSPERGVDLGASAAVARRIAIAEIGAAAAAWLVLSLVEATAIALEAPSPRAAFFCAALRVVLPWTLTLLAPLWVYSGLLAAAAFARRAPFAASVRARVLTHSLLVAIASVALATHVHLVLAAYPAFLWYAPLLAAGVAFAVALGLGHVDALRCAGAPSPRRRLFGALWPLAGLAGFATVHGASTTLFRGQYPTLHLSALFWAGALLQLGLFALGIRFVPWRRPRRTAIVAAGIALAFAAPAALAPADLVERARLAAADTNTLGQARLVGFSFDPASEDALRGPLPPEPRAAELFQEASRYPRLPEGFRLADYNVLLVTAEATRYDQTSLHDPGLRTTPTLSKLAAEGASSFSRAFAPSSGTLHSIASILCMTYPSMTRIETWRKAWHGRLEPEEETVTELFARSGYDTFLVSHDHRRAFQKAINGLAQGFAAPRYIFDSGDEGGSVATDVAVADAAIEELTRRARSSRRFFGWVFFVSPHSDYFAHYDDMPAGTDLERYRHEVRFVDEQLGRVVSALRDTGLLDRTILVFAGDHGEEFGEHGGTHHKTTVFTESTHVPLVIRVPGLPGRAVPQPSSTAYLFPWLAARGPEPLAGAAAARVRDEIAPMLRATGGAVVIELIGHDRMLSSLVYENEKINYDFISRRITRFDTRNDPLEHRDLLADDPALAADAARKVEAYARVRAAKRRYTLLPDR